MLRSVSSMPIFTMEEHMLNGGFGSAVSSFLVGEELPNVHYSFGIQDTFVQHGRRRQLLKYLGLDGEQMASRIANLLKERKKG